jgi:hypothetical protein
MKVIQTTKMFLQRNKFEEKTTLHFKTAYTDRVQESFICMKLKHRSVKQNLFQKCVFFDKGTKTIQ